MSVNILVSADDLIRSTKFTDKLKQENKDLKRYLEIAINDLKDYFDIRQIEKAKQGEVIADLQRQLDSANDKLRRIVSKISDHNFYGGCSYREVVEKIKSIASDQLGPDWQGMCKRAASEVADPDWLREYEEACK